VVGLSLLLFLIGTLVSTPTVTPTTSAPAGYSAQPAGTPLSADELIAAYVSNEVAADSRYKNQSVDVTGIIDSIGKDVLDTPYVKIRGHNESGLRGVQASFSRSDESSLAPLAKGQGITVRCRCTGLMMNVQLDRCSVLTPSTGSR
jgi:hypothetical protein